MRTVLYLLSHPPHVPYLVCSMRSLRRHYGGPVRVHAWRESHDLVKRVCSDPVLDAECVRSEPVYRGKNDQFIAKITLIKSLTRGDSYLYLDADTTVHGNLGPLFQAAERYGFCATQFNNWTTAGGRARGRVESLREFPLIPSEWIDAALATPWPSVNGGVWAALPESPVLPVWHEWAFFASFPRHTFIADEKVLHILQPRFVPDGRMTVLEGGAWNCSPIFQPLELKDEDVVIRHFHGDANTRMAKSERGCRLWWPTFKECWENDIGNVREWVGRCGNKYLRRRFAEEGIGWPGDG